MILACYAGMGKSFAAAKRADVLDMEVTGYKYFDDGQSVEPGPENKTGTAEEAKASPGRSMIPYYEEFYVNDLIKKRRITDMF